MDTKTIDIESALRRSPITEKGLALVRRIRTRSGPVRRVRGGRSIVNRFPLRCADRTVVLESGQETARVIQLDADPRTLEVWEQACRLSFSVKDGDAQEQVTATIDLLVIEKAQLSVDDIDVAIARLEPVMTWDTVERLLREHPERYELDDAGRPHDRYLEQYCREEFGIEVRIVTRRDIPVKVQQNEAYLRDLRLKPIEVPVALREEVKKVIDERPGILGTRLIAQVAGAGHQIEPIHVDQIAADDDLWFDRARDLIKDLDTVRLFPSRAMGLAVYAQIDQPTRPIETGDLDLTIGAQFKWGQQLFQVLNVRGDLIDAMTDGQVLPPIPVKEIEDRFKRGEIIGQARPADPTMAVAELSPKGKQRFLKRVERMRRSLETGRKDRTSRRLRREYERLASLEGHGIRALTPKFARCGRWGSRKAEDDLDLALSVAERQILQPGQRSLRFGWRAYCAEFRKTIHESDPSRKPMAWPTFRALVIRTWTKEQIERARKGYRAANSAAIRSPLGGGLGAYEGVPNGSVPFEVGHIDDTEIDLWVKAANGGPERCRLKLTLMVDGCSSKTLGDVLSHDDPSRRSMLQVYREVAENHGRLCEATITDNAKYFTSEAHQLLAAAKGIQLRRRPPGHGRSGSEVERKFKQLNALLHNLLGGNVPNQNPRSLVGSMAPQIFAGHTFGEIRAAIREALRIIDNTIDPATGKSPQQRFDEGLARIGDRPFRRVRLDLPFLILTSIVRDDPIKVGPLGIKVDGVHYMAEVFRDAAVQGTRVEVCDELYDISTKYVLVNGKWYVARSERFQELQGLTQAELQVATAEAMQRLRREPTQDELVELVLRLQSEAKRRADEERAARRRKPIEHSTGRASTEPDVFADAADALHQEDESEPDDEAVA